MDNIEYFKKKVKYWSRKLRLGKIDIIPDSEMWYTAFVDEYEGEKTLWYNSEQLMDMTKRSMMELVFHELGHFRHPFFKDSGKYRDWEYLLSEYMAEKQGLIWLKRYYSRHYKATLKIIPKELKKLLSYPKKYSYYFEAFSQIPEYAKYL